MKKPLLEPEAAAVAHLAFFAHRGASARAPENSLNAFLLAQRSFAEVGRRLGMRVKGGLAFDVQWSAPDEAGIRHLLVYQDTRISQVPWSILRNLEAGDWKSPRYDGFGIPVLGDVLGQAQSHPHLAFQIEIRRRRFWAGNDGLEAALLDELERYALRNRTLVTSCDPLSLLRFRNLLKKRDLLDAYGIGWVARAGRKFLRESWCALLRPEALILEIQPEWEFIINQHRQAGRQVFVATVNTAEEIFAAVAAGADGILSERPELLNQVPVLAFSFSAR